MSIPAGLVQMNFAQFLALTAVGSGIWNSIWISLGFTPGENWQIAERYSSILDYIVYAALGAALIYWLVRFVRRQRASREPLDR